MRRSDINCLVMLPIMLLSLLGCVQDGTCDVAQSAQSAAPAAEASEAPQSPKGITIHAPAAETATAVPVVGDVVAVESGLNLASMFDPKSIPPTAAPDVLGAFRFICGPGQIAYDDPIVYPGQPGKSHLHQFFGNLGANAHSTFISLRTSGESTCTNELNRSAYWMPAMLDGKGNVVRPNYVGIYYKRRPKSDPFCTTAAEECVGIPRGLRFIFGFDVNKPDDPQPQNASLFNFKCVEGWSPVTSAQGNLDGLNCQPGQWLSATISTPTCWDGVHLDSADHRSHLAFMKRDASTGWESKCPSTHPKIIPQFTMSVSYSVVQGDNFALWYLASDHMVPGIARGGTFHSDYFEGWEEEIRLRWEAGCLDQLLNCSDGDLGDGQIMKRNSHYPNTAINATVSQRLVPVPSNRSTSTSSTSSGGTTTTSGDSSTGGSGGSSGGNNASTGSSGGGAPAAPGAPGAPGPQALVIRRSS